MDCISLNITEDPQPLRCKPAEKSTPATTPKQKFSGTPSNGFSFEFGGGGQKVKAFVARKRPPATLPVSSSNTPAASATQKTTAKQSMALRRKSVAGVNGEPKSAQGQNKSTPKSLPVQHKTLACGSKAESNTKITASAAPLKQQNVLSSSSVKRPVKSKGIKRKSSGVLKDTPSRFAQTSAESGSGGGDSRLESCLISATESVGDDLTLNVFMNLNVAPPRQSKKPKLTRTERLKQKSMQAREKAALANRTLTRKEISEGIRKFSENPNKKPRVGDLPDKNGNPQTLQEKSTEKVPELHVAKPEPRKSNAFCVKRPADSSVEKADLFADNPEAKVMGQRLVRPIPERIFDGTKVESLPLHPHCVKNLADMLSITELTTVQQKSIPKALEGKDILVRSQTGSGKTLAYALPIVEKLQEMRPKITRDVGILAVVIVPTRELAIQTYELFQKLFKPFTWIVAGVLMGGERRKAEKARLRKGINVLVGTPGRLVDHLLHTESFKLSKAKFLVLDEADRMLEMGYERDVKQIVEGIDKQRQQLSDETKEDLPRLQRLLLSATLTSAVQKLAGLTLHEPIFIDNSDEDPAKAIKTTGYSKEAIEDALAQAFGGDETGILTIPENLDLSYVVVPPKLRLVTISGLLAKEFSDREKLKAIVFMSTMEMVNFHHDLLNEQLTRKVLDEEDEDEPSKVTSDKNEHGDETPLLKGLRFFKLHGSMTQTERQGVFKAFRECKSGVLLATDVVERGIDVPEVDLVVQYSPPQKTADFVHRVGRTARAGRHGCAVLFLTPSEVQLVRTLEDNRIRISQIDMDIYLKALLEADDEANTIQEAASNLQYNFQELIADDRELHDKACKAFVSWMKYYSTFPRELKPIFNIKTAHMGHFAKSFGLKEPPTSFARKHSVPKPLPPTNRLTYTERDPEKIRQERKVNKSLYATTVSGQKRDAHKNSSWAFSKAMTFLPKSLALNTSEFDSGLPAMKKKKAK